MQDVRIVIMIQGWVMVGVYSEDGVNKYLRQANVVRTWGTTKGLGEIALGGPTKETILDPCGFVDIPVSAVVGVIKCNAEKWEALFK
jgi:hypothetical protein